MENRGIEIAQKKARHRAGKSHQAGAGPGGRPEAGGRAGRPIFFQPNGAGVPQARFPSDIRPERRAIDTASTLAFVLAAPVQNAAAADAVAEPARTRPKAKPVKAKPRRKRKAAPQAAARTRAQPRTAQPAKSAKVRAAPPVTLVADLTPPVLPSLDRAASGPVADLPVAAQAQLPLPRARAVAVYRKNGLLDVIGYWLRSGWAGVARSFMVRTAPAKTIPPRKASVAQLLAENVALRKEVARLRALNGREEHRVQA